VEFKHLDLENGWASLYRQKTGERRRCKLWPETVAALQKAIAVRRPPVDQKHRSLVFLTRAGTSWLRGDGRNLFPHTFREVVLGKADFYRPGHAFYSLRRTFRTVADEVLDGPAIDLVMGHRDNSMGAVYRQKIADERLERVAEHVRNWLYAGREGGVE
jgi:integrase